MDEEIYRELLVIHNRLDELGKKPPTLSELVSEVLSKKPVFFDKKTVSLATANTNKLLEITGNFLWIESLAGTADIRFNERENDSLPLREGRIYRCPFGRVFVTNAAQAGKSLTLVAGKGLFGPPTGRIGIAGESIARLQTATGDEITDDAADAIKALIVNGAGAESKSFRRHIITKYPFGKGALRSTGIQWSDEVASSSQAWTTVEAITIEPPVGGDIVELYLGITWQQKSSGATKYVRGRVAICDKGGTLISVVDDAASPASGNAYVEDAADASSYSGHTFSGYVKVATGYNKVPLTIAVQVYPETDATEHAEGEVKNSSQVKIVYDE